jgi:hypothetical protein
MGIEDFPKWEFCPGCHWMHYPIPNLCQSCDEGDQFEEVYEPLFDPDETEGKRKVIPILEAA